MVDGELRKQYQKKLSIEEELECMRQQKKKCGNDEDWRDNHSSNGATQTL